jgi:hypothetical protein
MVTGSSGWKPVPVADLLMGGAWSFLRRQSLTREWLRDLNFIWLEIVCLRYLLVLLVDLWCIRSWALGTNML